MQTNQDRTGPLTTATGGGKGILELSSSNDRPAIVIVTIEIDHSDRLVV